MHQGNRRLSRTGKANLGPTAVEAGSLSQSSSTIGRNWLRVVGNVPSGDIDSIRKLQTMNVLEMAEMAVAASNDDPEGCCLTIDEVLRRLDTRGSRNAHLADPLVDESRFRSKALRGNEPVYGDFLALVYCAHYPLLRLDDFADISSMEEWMASDGGIVNSFATYVIIFIAGKPKLYAVAYTTADGTVQEFDKWAQNLVGRQPAENALKRWIVWK